MTDTILVDEGQDASGVVYIYAVRLQAKIVSLSNDLTEAVYQEIIDVTSSQEARVQAIQLDIGNDTHSAVLEYYVTLQDTGLPGDVGKYSANVFMRQIEPRLVLTPAA